MARFSAACCILFSLALLPACKHGPAASSGESKLTPREQRMRTKMAAVHAMAKEPAAGNSPAASGDAADPIPTLPEPERDVVVKMKCTGYNNTAKGKTLGFFLEGFWLISPTSETSKSMSFTMPEGGKGQGDLDMGMWKLRVVPKLVSATRGRYYIELSDEQGKMVGGFTLTDSGKQAALAGTGKGYSSDLVCYYAESRMTGYQFAKSGSRKPQYGVVLIGKGWNFVENSKKKNTVMGYQFPEFALVVVGPEWLKSHQLRRDMIDEIKVTGGYGSGGARFY